MNETRYARLYILVDSSDCDPPHSLDLEPGSRDSLKVESLTEDFIHNGFDIKEPALVGYPCDGRIQLISGTHRHEAAKRAGIKLPVRLIMRSEIEATWGTDERPHVVRDIPVCDLECVELPENKNFAALADRIEPDRDITWRDGTIANE